MARSLHKVIPLVAVIFAQKHPPFEAPRNYLVFKRWDKLGGGDEPAAVIFFATADVLSGLFTLANYELADLHGVFAPMGSGCSSIINYPFLEVRVRSSAVCVGHA